MRRNEDCQDGTYAVGWVPPAPGDYEISVDFKGTFGGVAGPVRGSPVTARFQKGQPAENNTMPGPAMIKKTTADVHELLQFATKVGHRLLLARAGAQSSHLFSIEPACLYFPPSIVAVKVLLDGCFYDRNVTLFDVFIVLDRYG